MTIIGIIRHGSTAWNKEGRAQGSSDIPLDQEGLTQARALAERLSKEEWDLIYSSELSRAKQTADIIAERLGLPAPRTDRRLREAEGGLIEGTTEQERIERWGKDWRELDLGIESYEKVTARGLEFLEEVRALHPNKKILLVSHGSFIRQLLTKITPGQAEEKLHNTSMTRVKRIQNGWDCELYNCIAHLNDALLK